MKIKIRTFATFIISVLFLIGCGGPSEEKITDAQSTYQQLITIHNQVVDAHKTIDDAFLDAKLAALLQDIKQLDSHNLKEMNDTDIDLLIENMNTLIASYQDCLDQIREFKEAREAAALVPVFFTLSNHTDMTFLKLTLCKKGDYLEKSNVLENTEGFVPGQVLTGLMVFRDVLNTPWVLRLENTEEESFEFPLNVETLKEEGESFFLVYEPETEELRLEN